MNLKGLPGPSPPKKYVEYLIVFFLWCGAIIPPTFGGCLGEGFVHSLGLASVHRFLRLPRLLKRRLGQDEASLRAMLANLESKLENLPLCRFRVRV